MLTDIEIAQQAEMEPIKNVAAKLGMSEDDIEMYGKYKAKISDEYMQSVKNNENGKLILVTAINPTPAGEGKTTVTVGLGQAMCKLERRRSLHCVSHLLDHVLVSKVEQPAADMPRSYQWKT